jgi:NAD(P)H-flavin reductase
LFRLQASGKTAAAQGDKDEPGTSAGPRSCPATSDVTFLLEVRHPQLARAARPGQFVIVMASEHGERIPLTIADYDRARGTVTLVIQAVGKTTREMQRDCHVGTRLVALVGPMGVPSHIGKARKVLCVGGGLGVAPVCHVREATRKRRT